MGSQGYPWILGYKTAWDPRNSMKFQSYQAILGLRWDPRVSMRSQGYHGIPMPSMGSQVYHMTSGIPWDPRTTLGSPGYHRMLGLARDLWETLVL